ncbi:MAG TPA: M14 family zinc carboxypeptidase [Sphingobacterium sp.]|nr:M14 family zinc carboxypeptidase [Sphingobacterium sp.]
MKKILFILAVVMASCQMSAEHDGEAKDADAMKLDTAHFDAMYHMYKEPALYHRRFKHADIDTLIRSHESGGVMAVEQIGTSFEGRAIYELSYGKGEKKVMLWSQMHGDEPTATMALFDLFNFLSGPDDEFEAVRKLIFSNLELHFIPMLNPDGAERFFRRNAQQIDLNRDARVRQTIEGALLRERARAVNPQYGFNLHDQNIYYNVPDTKNPVTISLLAPAFNVEREVNKVRAGAMQLIVGMNRLLQQYVPDGVAKYDDTHSPRGFGDNFQFWGASTVLIESGGLKGDPEKQQIRKLNFIIILNALIEIAEGSYTSYPVDDYDVIPFNASQLHDVVIRGIKLERDGQGYVTDIAIRRGEMTVGRDYYVRGRIEDIGDLQDTYGYDEIDARGYRLIPGKVEYRAIQSASTLNERSVLSYLKNGVIAVAVKNVGEDRESGLYEWPFILFTKNQFFPTQTIDLGGTANFFIGDEQGNLKYAVINGYLVDLSKDVLPRVKNKIF